MEGSRRAEALRARSGAPASSGRSRVGVLRRRSSAEARPVAARVRHCPLLKMVDVTKLMNTAQGCRSRSAGLSRPRPYGARHALRPHGARARENGRSDFFAASSLRVIRDVLKGKGASVSLAHVAKRIPYLPRQRAEREYERRPFPARGSRPRPDKVGNASAAAQSFELVV
jgi:hypothetical protein